LHTAQTMEKEPVDIKAGVLLSKNAVLDALFREIKKFDDIKTLIK